MSGEDWHGAAELVQRGDADRFAAGMAAPVAARAILFPLWAFNLEVARAAWAASEPLIGEMRLQWWRDMLDDVLQGNPPRAHVVVPPLQALLSSAPDLIAPLDDLVEARRWDLYRDPFEDQARFDAHIDRTAGSLAWAGARLLGATDEETIRRIGRAHGVAAWLEAVPELEARGRIPLVDGRAASVADLAAGALKDLRAVRGRRFGAADAALRAGWRAEGVLARAAAAPGRVAAGALREAEGVRRAGLMWRQLRGRR